MVRALGRRFTHIHDHVQSTAGWRTYLSAYYVAGIWYDVPANNMHVDLKWAVEMLNYTDEEGIPIKHIVTYSLRMGGANTLALSGYSNTQIKNGTMEHGLTGNGANCM